MAEKRKFKVSAERLVIFGLLVALTFTLAGFAIASAATKIPAGNGLVRFCRNNATGATRIVELTTACATGEQKVQMRSYDPIGVQINTDGTAVAGSARHVVSIGRVQAGRYLVTFDRNLSTCLVEGTSVLFPNLTVLAGVETNTPDQVVVFTTDPTTQTQSDDIVNLTVTC